MPVPGLRTKNGIFGICGTVKALDALRRRGPGRGTKVMGSELDKGLPVVGGGEIGGAGEAGRLPTYLIPENGLYSIRSTNARPFFWHRA